MFGQIKAYAWQFLAVMLLASLAANGALGWAYLGQRDATTAARTATMGVERERDGAAQAMRARRGAGHARALMPWGRPG